MQDLYGDAAALQEPSAAAHDPFLAQDLNIFPGELPPADTLIPAAGGSGHLPSISTPSLIDAETSLDFWAFTPDLTNVPWVLDDDFDIEAVDTALNTSISEWANLPMPHAPFNAEQASAIQSSRWTAEPNISHQQHAAGPPISREDRSISKRWFTELQPDDTTFTSTVTSPRHTQEQDVDERFQDSLSRKLRPRRYEDQSLSVKFLNVCLKLYFTRFHPIFPIVHGATFSPNSQNALLFLSICSIGSLFVGSAKAAAEGHKIFCRLNKAILSSWELVLSRTQEESLFMVQAALLGQTFGMLSGKSNDLVMVDAFQGTMVAWARRLGASEDAEIEIPEEGMGSLDLDRCWRRWAHREQLSRLLIALRIHDVEMAALFHHETIFRHGNVRHATGVDDAAFQATTAEKWSELIRLHHSRADQQSATSMSAWIMENKSGRAELSKTFKFSQFAIYEILENINGMIIESKAAGVLGPDKQTEYNRGLMLWYKTYYRSRVGQKTDVFNLEVLWHLSFMSLFADFDLLEQAFGRQGPELATHRRPALTQWAASADAARCLMHGYLVQELVENMRLRSTPAIHVPRALFSASLVWIGCSNVTAGGTQLAWHQAETMNFPEFKLLPLDMQESVKAAAIQLSSSMLHDYSGTVYNFIDLLQKISRWGISATFANILKELIE